MQYLYYAQLAFTIWMLVDAYQRQVQVFWYLIILLLPGFGSWVYFFLVKIGDFSLAWPGALFGPRAPSLDELRYQAEVTPTLASQLALADGLIERGQHPEAIPHLEAVLHREPDHSRALYLFALCRTELGHPEEAFPLLEQIIAKDRPWSDYAAWQLLISAKGQAGDGAGALAACQELVRLSPRLQFKCLLAERFLLEGMFEQAQHVLVESLDEYRFAPGPIRRRNRRWAQQARRLQKRALADARK